MKLFSKIAYHSTSQQGLTEFKPMTDEEVAYTGEGQMVHGWGLYLQENQELNFSRYKERFTTKTNKMLSIDGESHIVKGSFYTFLSDMLSNCGYGFNVQELRDRFEFLAMNDFADEPDKAKRLMDYAKKIDKYNLTFHFNDGNSFIEYTDKTGVHKVSEYWEGNVSQYTVEIPDDMVFIKENVIMSKQNLNDIIYAAVDLYILNSIEAYKQCIDRYNYCVEHSDIFDENDIEVATNNYNYAKEQLDKLNGDKKVFIEQYEELTGEAFYNRVALLMIQTGLYGNEKPETKASRWLFEHGIDGIEYNGLLDGHCYVIFNCSKLKIIEETR